MSPFLLPAKRPASGIWESFLRLGCPVALSVSHWPCSGSELASPVSLLHLREAVRPPPWLLWESRKSCTFFRKEHRPALQTHLWLAA